MDGWCVLVPHHLLEGRSEPAEAVLSVFQLGSQRVCLSACGGEFAVALLELSGQFLDTGNKLSDGRLLDLLSEPPLDRGLEPVPFLPEFSELGTI